MSLPRTARRQLVGQPLQYTGDPDQRGCQLNRIAHHCIGRTRFSDLSSPSFLSGELVGSIPKLLCRDPLLAEMVQYAAQSRQARQYVFAEPALGDGPNVLPSDPAALVGSSSQTTMAAFAGLKD